MAMPTIAREDISTLNRLVAGQPPPPATAAKLLVAFDRLMDQWIADLAGYIAIGGSLIRIVSAPIGSGKTHLARALQSRASEMNYLVCQIDAQAQSTDDDLSLYSAFCTGLTHPAILSDGNARTGLLPVLESVAERMAGVEFRTKLRNHKIPIPTLGDAIGAILDHLHQCISNGYLSSKSEQQSIMVLMELISGRSVKGTRSLAKIRREYGTPLLKKLARTPGKRDARLWLESLLRMVKPLGFNGVVLVLDEHDTLSHRLLDDHIVQLRRTLDKLTEGHLPGVFVVYFVLDTFRARVEKSHAALQQRVGPILQTVVPNRILANLEDMRDKNGFEFLCAIGERMYSLISDGSMPRELLRRCQLDAHSCCLLGHTDTRQFVKIFASGLLDRTG